MFFLILLFIVRPLRNADYVYAGSQRPDIYHNDMQHNDTA